MLPQLVFRRTVVGDQDASLLLLVYYFILFTLEDYWTVIFVNFTMFTLQKIIHYRLDLVVLTTSTKLIILPAKLIISLNKLAFLPTTSAILRTKISYPNVSNIEFYQQTNLCKLRTEDL